MTKPCAFFKEPIDFTVLNDYYTFRFNAFIDDTTYCLYKKISGNVMGYLKRGTIGKAYSKKIDNTGREWWLVEIPNEYKLIKSEFYEPDTIKPNKIGWVSSRYLKIKE